MKRWPLALLLSALAALVVLMPPANAVNVLSTVNATATFDVSGLDEQGSPVTILDVELVLSPATAATPDIAGGTVRSTTVLVSAGANTVSLAPLLVGTPDGEYRLFARTQTAEAKSAWCVGDTVEIEIPPEPPSELTITAITSP